MTNRYCEELGIGVPKLESVKDHREANTYALLIVALLENGDTMTLAEVARRFERAGIAPARRALLSLQRCKPARPPVYRDGDHYALDPYDDELDLWVFRLGLRPPQAPERPVVRPEPEPTRGPEEPLTVTELEEAWSGATLSDWPRQRLVVAVLDAHGRALPAAEVVAVVSRWAEGHPLSADVPHFRRRNSAVEVREDGRWAIAPGTYSQAALRAARNAVRERIDRARRSAARRVDPAAIEASQRAWERKAAAHAAELATMRRVILHAFPAAEPEALVLLDVGQRTLSTFLGDEISAARERLDDYDILAAVDVRALLRALDYEPGRRRLAELGPPQKTMTLNRRGRTLKMTNELLLQGSCGISRAFGDPEKLRAYLRSGRHTQLRRRLEADAKSLFALYQYGRLHGVVRLRWGFLDEAIPVPWVHRDETTLHGLKSQALEMGVPVEVVAGTAPGWSEPWSRSRRCFVRKEPGGYYLWLIDEAGYAIDDVEVQLARVLVTVH